MADDADYAIEHMQNAVEKKIGEITKNATIPPGDPGDCDYCGEWSGRLIRGICAPCRDRHKLP